MANHMKMYKIGQIEVKTHQLKFFQFSDFGAIQCRE